MIPEAPSALAVRAAAMAVYVLSRDVPTMIGRRPSLTSNTVLSTWSRSASSSLWASPATPSTVRPSTPASIVAAVKRRRLASSSAPSGRKGVARMA